MCDAPLSAPMVCSEQGVLDDLSQGQNATGHKLVKTSLIADLVGQFSSTHVDLPLTGVDHLEYWV